MIRITGGEFRGRKIKSPHGLDSRPTLDRVREAFFDILGNNLQGMRFADLYAGVGLVGLEALSRGAEEVYFVERQESLVKIIKENLFLLGVQKKGRVFRGPASSMVLRLIKKPLDIVFLDPPYGSQEAALILTKLGFSEVDPEILTVVQHHYKDKLPDQVGELSRRRQERYGESVLSFYKRIPVP